MLILFFFISLTLFVLNGDLRPVEACKRSTNSRVILPALDNLIVQETKTGPSNSGSPLIATSICPLNFKCPVAQQAPTNYVSDTFEGSKNQDLAIVCGVCIFFSIFSSLFLQPRRRITTPTPSVVGTSIIWFLAPELCWNEPSELEPDVACAAAAKSSQPARRKFSHCILLSSPLPPRHLAAHKGILATTGTNSGVNLAFYMWKSKKKKNKCDWKRVSRSWAPKSPKMSPFKCEHSQ